MIVVDTSVWISVLQPRDGRPSSHAEAFTSLLDADEVVLPAAVRTELLGGVRSLRREALRRVLTALPVVYPTDETWKQMDRWAVHAAERGQGFGVGDLLIAAMAKELGALVWSLDKDFERMERLGFVDAFSPR